MGHQGLGIFLHFQPAPSRYAQQVRLAVIGFGGEYGGTRPFYFLLTQGSTRLPLVFRFETGSDRLDNKSLRDVGRLLESLSQPANRGRRVLLIGFADSIGSAEANRRLSEARAAAVAGELRSEGVEPDATSGFGSALPVASNETEEGKARNRRVEVWLK